ncbi:hypothetical protein LGMK_06945 [Leuconostoc sp. C2]|nr:hypothetical protein LGMK_06945 [Leuconostoc sp. C2]
MSDTISPGSLLLGGIFILGILIIIAAILYHFLKK